MISLLLMDDIQAVDSEGYRETISQPRRVDGQTEVRSGRRAPWAVVGCEVGKGYAQLLRGAAELMHTSPSGARGGGTV